MINTRTTLAPRPDQHAHIIAIACVSAVFLNIRDLPPHLNRSLIQKLYYAACRLHSITPNSDFNPFEELKTLLAESPSVETFAIPTFPSLPEYKTWQLLFDDLELTSPDDELLTFEELLATPPPASEAP